MWVAPLLLAHEHETDQSDSRQAVCQHVNEPLLVFAPGYLWKDALDYDALDLIQRFHVDKSSGETGIAVTADIVRPCRAWDFKCEARGEF